MDYSKQSRTELIALCKERKIKKISGKKKEDLIVLLSVVPVVAVVPATSVLRQEIVQGDALEYMKTLSAESAQIVLADPPYNIGKDFGNDSDKQPMDKYLEWTSNWITEALRILKSNGTMFIFGFSENLALITARLPTDVNRRWLIWHYTNKSVPSLNFWQRSHESILAIWKTDKVFHKDAVREAYTDGFLNGAAGKERAATKGRFSSGEKTTVYKAHPDGALPRDVIKIPALAGGAGAKERVDHPTQKPLALCERLLKSCRQPADAGYVLIPFAGSGSECVAARDLGLPFVGIELNPVYVALARNRLSPPSP